MKNERGKLAFTLPEMLVSITLFTAVVGAASSTMLLCMHTRAKQVVQEYPLIRCQRAVSDIQYAISQAVSYEITPSDPGIGTPASEGNCLSLTTRAGVVYTFKYEQSSRTLKRIAPTEFLYCGPKTGDSDPSTAPISSGVFPMAHVAADPVLPERGVFTVNASEPELEPIGASNAGLLKAEWTYRETVRKSDDPGDLKVTDHPFAVHASSENLR